MAKTFAGSFGPYMQDPRPYLSVELCQEWPDFPNVEPVCETVENLAYRDGQVSWALGYDWDEFPAYQHPPRSWAAFYRITANGYVVESSHAPIRLVRD